MLIGVTKETYPGERRVALTPNAVKKLVALGLDIEVEAGLGAAINYSDADYQAAGATLATSAEALYEKADILLRVRKPESARVAMLKKGALHISFLDLFNEDELVAQLARQGVRAISMEMIPRTTTAQRMDALSSQASLAGYAAVLWATRYTTKVMPMMMTPAGTIAPCRVFVVGAGVAGLQAIATAKRLGARVEAFDTRPVVADQVRSLGAKFVEIDLGGETGQTEHGYAKALTKEQIAMQQAGMKKVIASADIVITTAQVFGRPAPRIVSKDMLEAMSPGSVVVDMAVETGGNVEGSQPNEVVTLGRGVQVVGQANLSSAVASPASEMYAANLTHLIGELWDQETKQLNFDTDNEIIRACLVTQDGAVVSPALAT